MPSPKMSRRQQAEARRRIRDLEALLYNATKVVQTQTLTTWADIGQRMRDQIDTARVLGYTVEVHTSGTGVTLTAVKREYLK